MSKCDDIERDLDNLENLMEVLDPELQGPADELVEQICAQLETADR